jgi:hypothetical protein
MNDVRNFIVSIQMKSENIRRINTGKPEVMATKVGPGVAAEVVLSSQ